MTLRELMHQSALHFANDQRAVAKPVSADVFRQGGAWMRAWLYARRSGEVQLNDQLNFNTYGWLKYVLCLSALFLSAWAFYYIGPWLMPLSLIVFYIAEVHFVFLFPLLIDGVEYPLWTSIRLTYRIGLFRLLARVIPIALFMMAGLFRFSDPLRNWYTGCLAILIWYEQDVRNRI